MSIEAPAQGKPTLEQGCLLSVGVVVLAFGGCVAASALGSDLFFQLSAVAGCLSGLIGLVLLIARFDRWLRRTRPGE